jgi:hypothetical protein
VTYQGKLDISQLKLSIDENMTFVIGDSMKKIQCDKNKSQVNYTNTKFILISLDYSYQFI